MKKLTAIASIALVALFDAHPGAHDAPTTIDLATPAGVLQYLSNHRHDSSLVAYSVAADGSIDRSDTVVAHNADQPMPLASTIKIITLAAYAREVAAGRLDPSERVAVADWEQFYQPGFDGFAHPSALAAYFGFAIDELGFAADREATVAIDDLVAVMLQFSDNAAADYLLNRFGAGAMRRVIRDGHLTGQELPQPIVGVFLSWANHDMGDPSWKDVWRLVTMAPRQYAARVSMLANRYAHDDAWRAEELAWIVSNPDISFDRAAFLANRLFPAGTARDYARIMAHVMTGTFISPDVSAIMRRQLDWPLRYIPSAPFSSWGHKGGSLSGVLTDANFFVPIEGDFTGRRRVAVLFLRNLAQDVSIEFTRTAGQSLFDREIASSAAFAAKAARVLR
jgi:hypothetical protein